ncbi:GNAT family N-acetyltransferase [Pseudobacter ginsenosidimutans]|uniref:N-acetylglutamate synthase-like GNAT family acetyltransferase n=1 Tax=Pseudobacter ginsenosidimutans TaxID=661488 RepID=A0A4Q7N1A3_9BACT|nr:GNAT family N-acetyltransferase [Pseudobacter ginsenosidimutans]QEC43567.1 GNAT family N-acetyltransferase [Pseudobacter ginsenosidimutans]RZS74962.1 N-acetylglutamate synthase-like GNAT family acetyltransferase [Pseudobacter ginsenosidimutans]
MTELIFRKAATADLDAIIALLADDILGASRENAEKQVYIDAFHAIDTDPNQFLAVAEENGRITGTLQLTFIPGLSRSGMKRGQIEAMRIASDRRGEGLGEAMFEWAIEKCRKEGCGLVQLTTDRKRPDAHRFYERLGFEASHIGYKLQL